MKKVIEKEGYETFIASGGREGMEIFAREDPDLVITDLMMPDMDGMEVMHLVKKASPGTEVILITGYGEYEMAVQALREGALDYLKKPIDID
ncbi:response regulator, partial [bacterium]|nr:response regulator [bacterium]